MKKETKHYQVGDVVRFMFDAGVGDSFYLYAQVMTRYDEETVKIEFGYWSACDEDPVLYFMKIEDKYLKDPDPNIKDGWLANMEESRAERDERNRYYDEMEFDIPHYKWWGKKPEGEE